MKEIQAESLLNFDFAAEFKTRLEEIGQLSEEESITESFKELGITRIKRITAAIVFPRSDTEDAPLEIWIDELDNYAFIHGRVRKSFKSAFPSASVEIPLRDNAAIIVQDWDNKLYLILEIVLKNEVLEMKKEGILLGTMPEKNPASWEKLVKNYNIFTIASTVQKRTQVDGHEFIEWVEEVILDVDIIGKLREAQMIRFYKDKYSMNLAQFMRFRVFVENARSSQTSISYDAIAQQIIKL